VNVFRRIEEVRMQRRLGEEAPVLLSGKRVQRGARGIADMARWLGIGSLSLYLTGAQQDRHGDHYRRANSGRKPKCVQSGFG